MTKDHQEDADRRSADELRRHLLDTHLSGQVQTSPSSTLRNCSRLVRGDELATFGLSDWREVRIHDAVEAVRVVCGAPLPASHGTAEAPEHARWMPPGSEAPPAAPVPDDAPAPDLDGPGWIDPEATLAGVERHRERLATVAAHGGLRVLVATGHPTGLLAHYQAIARALQGSGSTLLTPTEGRPLRNGADGRRRELRYLDGVACLSDGASLRHTHRSTYMEMMLDELGGYGSVDLVIADHGFAGAAIERGIPTLAIADVNDVALPLAQFRGRSDGVLPIDDNLVPRAFVPVTARMLDW